MGGSNATCRSEDPRRRAEPSDVVGLLRAAGLAGRVGARRGGGANPPCCCRRPPSPAAQTRRAPAACPLAARLVEIRPLALEREALCLGAWALCPTPDADRQLDPRLLGARTGGLDMGRREMDLLTS